MCFVILNIRRWNKKYVRASVFGAETWRISSCRTSAPPVVVIHSMVFLEQNKTSLDDWQPHLRGINSGCMIESVCLYSWWEPHSHDGFISAHLILCSELFYSQQLVAQQRSDSIFPPCFIFHTFFSDRQTQLLAVFQIKSFTKCCYRIGAHFSLAVELLVLFVLILVSAIGLIGHF